MYIGNSIIYIFLKFAGAVSWSYVDLWSTNSWASNFFHADEVEHLKITD